MAETIYPYVAADFPGSAVNPGTLKDEIQADPGILIALERIDTIGGTISNGTVSNPTSIDIVFKDPLPAGQKTILDGDISGPAGGLIASHDNSETPSVVQPKLDADGIPLTKNQAQRYGLEPCNKDIRLTPGKFDQANSVEDLKVDIDNNQELTWAGPELTLVGVYKADGTACINQAECDTSGVCTVWDYKAIDQADGTTEIAYDIRGGSIIPDSGLPGSELWDHKVYVVAAPGIASNLGGRVRLFDGYLRATGVVEELNSKAKYMDPSQATGANILRIWIFHPVTSGATFRTHVLRLITYRALGTS